MVNCNDANNGLIKTGGTKQTDLVLRSMMSYHQTLVMECDQHILIFTILFYFFPRLDKQAVLRGKHSPHNTV